MSRTKIFPFFLSRQGCPGQCVYCRQEVHDAGDRHWTPSRVATSLEAGLPSDGDVEIAFYGGSFTLLPEPLQRDYLAVAAGFVARGRARAIRLSTHPAGLDARCLRLLADWPLSVVEVGCQSFADSVLRAAGRGHDARQIREGVRRLRRLPVQVGLQLMPGLPGGGHAEALTSLRQALALEPDFIRVYPTVVLPGTPLARMAAAGSYRPWSLDEAVETCADMWLLCRAARVPVRRIGIPPLVVEPVAGPWHPAFGQLVISRLWRRALEAALRQGGGEIQVPARQLSDATGHRRDNLAYLEARFGTLSIRGDKRLAGGRFKVGDRDYAWPRMVLADNSAEIGNAV